MLKENDYGNIDSDDPVSNIRGALPNLTDEYRIITFQRNGLHFAAPAEATWRLRCSEAWRLTGLGALLGRSWGTLGCSWEPPGASWAGMMKTHVD